MDFYHRLDLSRRRPSRSRCGPFGSTNWWHRTPIRSCVPPVRCCCCLAVCALRLARVSFASLMEQVAEAINFFEKDIRSAGISEQQANSAKYILCATADDIVQHIPTDDRHVWTQYSMLSRFFGERVGGVRFFEILNHNKLDPLINYPVLELQHACLALGFQGMYRAAAGGLANLQQIQRDLYETLATGTAEGGARSLAALAGPGHAGNDKPRAAFRSGSWRRLQAFCCLACS